MNKKSGTSEDAADKLVKGIKRKTRMHYSDEAGLTQRTLSTPPHWRRQRAAVTLGTMT